MRPSTVSRPFQGVCLALAALSLSGCLLLLPPTSVPIPTIRIEPSDPRSETLVVLLPGRGDRAETFLETGFVDAGVGSDYDLVAVDAHFGYYAERSLPQRLHEDVIIPAREQGYDRIWLLGISLGGLGSVLYTTEFPGNVDGLILLAPFLGDPCLADEITAAGGLPSWSGTSRCAEDFEVDVWVALRRHVSERSTPVILGYGMDDRLVPAYEPLAAALPSSQVYAGPGRHNWTTWTELWREISGTGRIASRATPP